MPLSHPRRGAPDTSRENSIQLHRATPTPSPRKRKLSISKFFSRQLSGSIDWSDGMTEMDDVLKDRLNSLKADRDRAKAALERAKSQSSLPSGSTQRCLNSSVAACVRILPRDRFRSPRPISAEQKRRHVGKIVRCRNTQYRRLERQRLASRQKGAFDGSWAAACQRRSALSSLSS